MNKQIYQNQVCMLLAQQLIEEEAKLTKQEAVVNDIKQTIIHAKKNLIREFVEGKLFKIRGKKYAVLNVSGMETENKMFFALSLGQEPNSAVEGIELTDKEAELMAEYKEAYDNCQLLHSAKWAVEVSDTAIDMLNQEHGIHLHHAIACEFDFTDATEPGFFTKTGVEVGGYKGASCEKLMLEDVVVRNESEGSLAPIINLKLF